MCALLLIIILPSIQVENVTIKVNLSIDATAATVQLNTDVL